MALKLLPTTLGVCSRKGLLQRHRRISKRIAPACTKPRRESSGVVWNEGLIVRRRKGNGREEEEEEEAEAGTYVSLMT
jgi:hypothetical protein